MSEFDSSYRYKQLQDAGARFYDAVNACKTRIELDSLIAATAKELTDLGQPKTEAELAALCKMQFERAPPAPKDWLHTARTIA